MTLSKKVAVIGGGISGLAAASSLVDEGFEVFLLEASNYFGGRIKQAEAFPGFPPVDLGGGFIHGSNTVTQTLAKENGWKIKKAHGCDDHEHPLTVSVFIDGKLYPEQSKEHPDVFRAYKLIDELTFETEKYLAESPKKDSSEDHFKGLCMSSWLHKKGANQNVVDVINATFCQTHGGTLDTAGVLECGLTEINWEYGSGNYRLEGSYSVLISYFVNTRCAKVDKRLNWPVKEIIWKDNVQTENANPSIKIISTHGKELFVDHAIVTVPLIILKARDILFSPPLPINKQNAIDSIYVSTALKIVCRFQKPFWGECSVVYCPRSFLKQVWMYSRDPKSDGEECHIVVGFETAASAAQKVHLSDEQVCEQFVEQLDKMFGTESDPKPASSYLVSCVYEHWSKHPYIRGGYHCPTVNSGQLKKDLAQPLEGKLFFAGEATCWKTSGEVQGALATGERAAKEVLETCEHFQRKMDEGQY